MSPADWAIVAVLVLNVVFAAVQGFFAEACNVAGLVVGYVVAAWQFQRLAEWLSRFLKWQWLAEILGFLLIFFAILLLFATAGRIARWLMKEVGLSGFDRFLGGVVGLLKGGLMVAIILMGMTAFTPTSKVLENSQLAPYFLVVGRAAIWLAPSPLRARFYQGLDLLHHAPQDMNGSRASRPH
ncbi:MAG TPA: CvpA family protein [Candidatus Sulfotelmatobacter sp.]|nr:CvpA family protein [Candidatus Sulfotelmatobacter sp.]